MRKPQLGIAILCLSVPIAFVLRAQEATPTPGPTPTPTPVSATTETSPLESALKEPVAFRPIEANVIINLPSVDVPSEKTLTFLVTHRFVQRIQEGNINNFYTLDSGNTWGFGLWYAPLKNLNAGLYRSANPKSSFFAQVILAYNFGKYVRISAVPTYLQQTNGFPNFFPEPVPGDQSCEQT